MGNLLRGHAVALLGAAALAGSCWSAVAAGAAHATALGPWRQVASTGLQNISELGLARTPDGTLHAAWVNQSPTSADLDLIGISPTGSLSGVSTIAPSWAELEDPGLGLTSTGALQAFFGGMRTLNPGEVNSDMNMQTAGVGALSNYWALVPGDVVAPGASAYGSPVAVSNSFAGQASPFETWYGTSGVWVHAGIDPNTPNSNYQTFGCCGYYSNLASDSAGNTEVAWYSNAIGSLGVWAQAVAADGSPSGSPMQMPGTANMSVGEAQRTPLVARPQGGFYVVYPTGYPSFTAVRIWKVGSGAVKVASVNSQGGTPAAGAAVDSAGRVWVFWTQYSGATPRLYATRSNPSVTRFGAVVPVGSPTGTGSTYAIDGNASSGALDVFATLNMSGQNPISIWTRHVFPGLTVAVSPASAKLRHVAKVTVTVTDAGVPVKGASVKLGSHRAKTNAAGKALIRLKVGGSLAAVASRAGYVNGTAKLTAVH